MKKFIHISTVLVFLSTCVMAQKGYTSQDGEMGDWSETTTWTRSSASLAATPGSNVGGGVDYVDIYGKVTHSGNIKIGSNVTMTVYDTLLVDGNLEVAGQSSLVVEAGGVLIVTGDFVASGGTVSTNDGRIVVQGNLTASGSSDINNNTDDFYVYGTITDSGGSTLSGAAMGDEMDLSSNDPSLYDLASGGTLPVEFAYVKAKMSSNRVVIEWATASEINNDYFTVERSKDGVSFETIASVNGAGNSETMIAYEVEDDHAAKGTNYYRVKQTDLDDNNSYSGVVTINNNTVADFTLNVYPNPAADRVNINISDFGTDVNIQILDINGSSVYNNEFNANSMSVAKVDLTTLPKGMYYVTLTTGAHALTKNLLIK